MNGLRKVDEAFRTVGKLLGFYLRRVPDGEVECGMARARSEETVRALLKIHADICADG